MTNDAHLPQTNGHGTARRPTGGDGNRPSDNTRSARRSNISISASESSPANAPRASPPAAGISP